VVEAEQGHEAQIRIGVGAVIEPWREEMEAVADVARRLGVSRSWLYEAARQGRVPCVRLGGVDGPLRFTEHDLAQWLERGRSRELPPQA